MQRFLLSWAVFVMAIWTSGPIHAQSLKADDLFSAERIVQIQIEMPEEEWDALRLQSRAFVQALGKSAPESPFTYFKANVTVDGVLIENVGIRKKGFLGSLDDNRPSLKIKFAEYVDQQPVDGLDRLTLNNNKQDNSRLSQYLASKLYNQSGTIAPRCSLALVSVNGKSLGIYSNVESVKKPFLKRGFGDDTGPVFEGTVADFCGSWFAKLEPKNKAADKQVLQEIAEVLETEPLDLDRLEKLLDVDAFLNFWAMESLIGFWDGYCHNQNNYFIYRNPGNDLWYFMPWGVDSAFTKTMPLPPYRVRPRSVHANAILPNRLYRIPEIRDRYLKRFNDFLNQHWDEEALIEEIERMKTMMAEHIVLPERDFSRGINNVRRFVKTRRKDLNRELKDGPPELKSLHRSPAYFANIGEAKVTFSTEWFDVTPRDASKASEVQVDLTLNGETVELENMGAYAERSKWPSPEKVKPPSIVVFGTRKSDGKRLAFGIGMSGDLFKPTNGEAVDVAGVFMVDNNFMSPDGGMRMIGGHAKLEQASVEKGKPVSGSLHLFIAEMKGGKPIDEVQK